MKQNRKLDSVMEPETISKNGASSKSRMSRGDCIMISILACFFAIILAFSSCQKFEKESERLEVTPTSLNFDSASDYQKVFISSNSSWSASSSSSWCQVSPSYGYGNSSIEITVDRNSSSNSRETTVAVQQESQVSIRVYQSGVQNSGGGGSTSLSAPTGVTATQNGSSVVVSWNSVQGATSYKVYWSSSTNGTYSLDGTSNSTRYTDYLPLSGYNYYKVKAENNAGESALSSYASCNYSSGGGGGGGGGGGATTVPSAPTGVIATNVGSALIPDIRVSWNSVSGATSYKLYRSSSASGSYSQIGSATTFTYLSDFNPREGSNYYRVRAVNSAGESANSNYALYNYDPSSSVKPCPPTYGNCTVSGTTITMRWSVSTTYGCGIPTKAYLRVKYPTNSQYSNVQTLSGTTTSASFNYSSWVDSEGYVWVGILLENDKGTSGGIPMVYDTKNKKWLY